MSTNTQNQETEADQSSNQAKRGISILFALEEKTEKITKSTHSISIIAELIETFRAHNSAECPLEAGDVDKIASNGSIISGLADAIDVLSDSINNHMYELVEAGKKK